MGYFDEILGTGRKRKSLTPGEKLWMWENKPHKCHICGKRIAKLSEAEFDHIRAYSKGGTRMALSHRLCNRVKSNKSLTNIQKRLGIRRTKKRRVKKRKRKSKRRMSWGERIVSDSEKATEKRMKDSEAYWERKLGNLKL